MFCNSLIKSTFVKSSSSVTFPMMPVTHLDQVVQRVELLLQLCLRPLHCLSLVLWVRETCCLDLTCVVTQRSSSSGPTALLAQAIGRPSGEVEFLCWSHLRSLYDYILNLEESFLVSMFTQLCIKINFKQHSYDSAISCCLFHSYINSFIFYLKKSNKHEKNMHILYRNQLQQNL